MVESDLAYERGLAQELGSVLTGGKERKKAIMRDGPPVAVDGDGVSDPSRGLIGLDEVWCIWNRLRGVSLVSPSALLSACRHLPDFTRPEISLHRFASGLLALATPYYSTRSFGSRLLKMLDDGEDGGRGVGVIEVAKAEKIGIGLAGEMCTAVEMALAAEELGLPGRRGSAIVRDEQVAGVGAAVGKGTVRWWRNEIEGFEWKDPNEGFSSAQRWLKCASRCSNSRKL